MSPRREPLLLVVDDDSTVRRVLKVSFERAGFRVLVAEHGVDALNQMETAGEPVKLVLTDVVMPEMGGVALAERALAQVPPPKVILMSGFNHTAERLVVAGMTPKFVQKPFKIDELVRLVRSELGLTHL